MPNNVDGFMPLNFESDKEGRPSIPTFGSVRPALAVAFIAAEPMAARAIFDGDFFQPLSRGGASMNVNGTSAPNDR